MSTVPLNINIDAALRIKVVQLAKDELRTITATVEMLISEALDARRENGLSAKG